MATLRINMSEKCQHPFFYEQTDKHSKCKVWFSSSLRKKFCTFEMETQLMTLGVYPHVVVAL